MSLNNPRVDLNLEEITFPFLDLLKTFLLILFEGRNKSPILYITLSRFCWNNTTIF
jgi:hypothetical protein